MGTSLPPLPGPRPTGFVGILYAEDFDDPPEPCPPSVPEAAPPPAITPDDVQRACAEAVRAAQAEWQASHDQARLDALASIAAELGGIRTTAEQTTLLVAEGTVVTILSIVCALLPRFAREHGPAEVRALLEQLLPTLRSRERIAVRVHPDLVAAVRRDVEQLDADLAELIDVAPAPVEPGDVKVNWENGSLQRNSRQIAQAVEDALGQLGLHRPIEAPAKRSMAHAD